MLFKCHVLWLYLRLLGKANTYLRYNGMALFFGSIECKYDVLMNKTPISPIVPLLPDHLGSEVLDLSLDQEPGVNANCTTEEPIPTVSPSLPDTLHSASHRSTREQRERQSQGNRNRADTRDSSNKLNGICSSARATRVPGSELAI